MRLKHYLYIVPLALFAACSSDDIPNATAEHPNGAIELTAGIVEGPAVLHGSTRATEGATVLHGSTRPTDDAAATVLHGSTRAGAEDNHSTPGHLALTVGTKLALQVSGAWTGHGTGPVTQTTTGTIGAETAEDSKHNVVTCAPVLYWDDYGTADPDNASGRSGGLTIYGVAIDGKTDDALTVSDYTALEWTLAANQTSSGETPADKDLLISNNVQGTNADTNDQEDHGTYLFDYRSQGKLLEFTHALSKITVNLKAGDGFNGSFISTAVTLTSNEAGASTNTEWPYTTGTINVTSGAVSSQATPAAITMCAATPMTGYNVTKEALVMPGSAFASNDAIIARINADGNVYYVTAEKIRAAALATSHTAETGGEILTRPGYNYIINVVVDKTAIQITATVKNWIDVESEEVAPKMNINVNHGEDETTATIFDKHEFSFFRRTSEQTIYDDGMSEHGYYKEVRRVRTSDNGRTWNFETFNTTTTAWDISDLYWPNHNTHYQLRGVWPPVTTNVLELNRPTKPRVEITSGDNPYQYVKIWNVPYNSTKVLADDDNNVGDFYPSDLQIARPYVRESDVCNNTESGHATGTNLYSVGICATAHTINMKFKYMMARVDVNLTTSTDIDKVELENAKVELVNIHKTGNVKLDDMTIVPTGTVTSPTPVPDNDTFGDYVLGKGNHFGSYAQITEPAGSYVYTPESGSVSAKVFCQSAIVPQPLTYTTPQADGNVKFRITITNSNGTKDVYYADVAPIKKTGSTDFVAKAMDTDDDGVMDAWYWESGYHYVYNLKLTKTEVKVTATLADWTTVTAEENVWF